MTEFTGLKLVTVTDRVLPEGPLSDYPGIFNIQHLCSGPGERNTYLVSVGMLYMFNASATVERIADDYEAGELALPCDEVGGESNDFFEVGELLVEQRETAMFF